MKKILLAGVAAASLFAASGAASAADLPSRHVQPVAVAIAPIFTWTGFYVGVNAGYAWNTKSNNNIYWNNNTVAGSFNGNNNNNDGGFTGGGQLGYNYQFGQFVAGVEADINYADLKHKNSGAFAFGNNATLGNWGGASNNGIEWFGTVRARLGVAFDQALIYGTGGFAYGGSGNNNNGFIVNGQFFEANSNSTRTGWTLGAGVEYAFTNNITARVEGLYVNLGKSSNNNWFAPAINNRRKDTEFGVVRAGLNYKFDSF